MKFIRPSRPSVLAFLALITSTTAQTYSNCNPLTQGGCPPDTALGKTVSIDFTQGASDSFTAQGNPTYDSNGVSFTVAQSGDSPQLTSKWYIMFGRVDVVLKAAPGAGIVSSFILQSDDLDEIDWEWLGADSTEVQSNYFGKGQTITYNRGAFHSNPGNQDEFITYTIIWTADQVVWQVAGTTVRVLTPETAETNQYPQTPMQVKLGIWSGGDPSNPEGTIEWARGPTDYSAGPFTMQVKSVTVADYSTGTSYSYSGTSGNWQDITAAGGSVDSGGTPVEGAAPAITSSSSGQPVPFDGTHRSETTSWVTPTVYPWVPYQTTLVASASPTYSNYPGLPSGWTVTSSGKVVPPSSAPLTYPPAQSTSSPQVSQQGLGSSGYEEITTYDQQGFETVMTVPAGWETMSKSYDSQGFLVTPAPPARPVTTTAGRVVAAQAASASSGVSAPASAAAASNNFEYPQISLFGMWSCSLLLSVIGGAGLLLA